MRDIGGLPPAVQLRPIWCWLIVGSGRTEEDRNAMAVVDASVVVDWVAPSVDLKGPAGALLQRLAATDEALFGPALLLEEVANALLTGIRRGQMDRP